MPLIDQYDIVNLLLHGDTNELRQQLSQKNIQLSYVEWHAILTLSFLPQQTTFGSHFKLEGKLKLIAEHIAITRSLINDLLVQYSPPNVGIRPRLAVAIAQPNATTPPLSNVFLDNTIIANLAHLDVFADVLQHNTNIMIPAILTQDITSVLNDGASVVVAQSRLAQAALAMHVADGYQKQLFMALRMLAKSLACFYIQLLQTPHSEQTPVGIEMLLELRLALNKWQGMYKYFVELLPHAHVFLEKAAGSVTSEVTTASIIPAATAIPKTTAIVAVSIISPSPIAPPAALTREAFFKNALLDPAVPRGTKARANVGVIGAEYVLLQQLEKRSLATSC